MSALIEVQVDSIRVHMPSGQHVVILKEREAARYLPIWIGVFEASAIARRITGVTPERPMSHDLMVSILNQLKVSLRRIVVTGLSSEVYYAHMHFVTGESELDIDARPSDAIAIAVRMDAPIFVSAEVLDQAGVLPDQESEQSADEEDRLSIFRELVNNLDLPDEPGRSSS